MRSIKQLTHHYIFKPFLKLYLKNNISTTYHGFKIKILAGVFHPKLFFSTTYFFDFISKLDLKEKSFLEIGSGSGVLSLLAHKKGAIVTSIDIDSRAVETTRINFEKNFTANHRANIIESDLFSNISKQIFDIIIINPPYYFKRIENNDQLAWYCGENGEYFKKLFYEVKNYTTPQSEVYIVLEENCEIERISKLANEQSLILKKIDEQLIKWELNFIYLLTFKDKI